LALNVPSGNVKNVSFGPGVLFIGAPGSTPTTDVGYVRGSQLSFARTPLDLNQGMPDTLIKRWITAEQATLTFTGLELTLANLKDALGAGEISGTNLGLGGDLNTEERAVMLRHSTQAGYTIFVDFYFATREGDFSMSFENDFLELPFGFRALETATDWAGAALSEQQRLFRIRRLV